MRHATATLVIAVLGVVLSASSITWQIATFSLSGGRAKTDLRIGAIHQHGSGMIHGPVADADEHAIERHARQGYTEPIIAVRVRNVGRLPITVNEWSVKAMPGGVAFQPVADSIGPALPHQLLPGTSEVWAMPADRVWTLVETTAATFGTTGGCVTLTGEVSLGDGRISVTQEWRVRPRPDGTNG